MIKIYNCRNIIDKKLFFVLFLLEKVVLLDDV